MFPIFFPAADAKPPDYSEVVGDNPQPYPMGGYSPYPPQGAPIGGPPQYTPQAPAPMYTQTPQPLMSGYTTQYGPNNTVIVSTSLISLSPCGVQ